MSELPDYLSCLVDFGVVPQSDFDESQLVEINDDWLEAELSKGVSLPNLSFGNSRLVGHGQQTNQWCNTYRGLKGCPRVENHHNNLMGNFEGKVYRIVVHHDCGKPECPTCYPIWAKRAGKKIDRRLKEASKQNDAPVEHGIVSFPASMYGLELDVLRHKVEKALRSRGFLGGSLISHAFRYNPKKRWYLSIHWHTLGLLKGYSRCRHCSHNPERVHYWDDKCRGCDGFEGLTRRLGKRDGLIVKVADPLHERWSVVDTAEYELSHASYDVTKKRSNVVTWFGVASYRKLKVKPVVRKKAVCPACGEGIVDMIYTGSRKIVTDVRDPDFRRESWVDGFEDGRRVYEELVRVYYRRGSYEGDMDGHYSREDWGE